MVVTIQLLDKELKKLGFTKVSRQKEWVNSNFRVTSTHDVIFTLYINNRQTGFWCSLNNWNQFIDFKNGIKDLIS